MPGSFAEFTLSRNCRFFASLRMTSEGLRMTSVKADYDSLTADGYLLR
jgi:hypothetical protein